MSAADGATMSFTDAAEKVLTEYADRRPMYYRDITAKALELGLVKTAGKTPQDTLYASIHEEIKRASKRGDVPRFVRHAKGLFSLSEWEDRRLTDLIADHNRDVRDKLLERLHRMHPEEFERCVGSLLIKLGFEVEVTQYTKDGGIDVRGTLVVGDVIRTHMAVQVKRWKNNVPAPIVQQVRGSLGAHDRGLIITTSSFTAGAQTEANRRDAAPVALMNGEQLVEQLVVHEIGIQREEHHLIELDESEDGVPDSEPPA